MRFRDRPLLVDGLDADLYLDRPELEARIVAPLRDGRNVLVLGDAGSGKSTLLRKAVSVLEQERHPAVLVNAAPADDAASLLELVDEALEERLVDRPQTPSPETGSRTARLLRAARRLRREQSAAILVDGLIDPNLGYDLFGRLRDELWSSGHSWAVAVRARDSAVLRTPPADAFWTTVVEIPTLTPEETEGLLKLGLSPQEQNTVDANRPIAGVHPRYLIRWAQDLLDHGEHSELAASPWHLHLEKASDLGRSEAMAVAELQGLGRPVSAHDSELLERLGWSRPYAQRILSGLEERGLLRSIPERRDKAGRPRKLYELNPTPPGL